MAESSFQRATAYKFRLGDLFKGKNVIDGDRFKFLELGNKKIVRVNVVANVIEKFLSEGEKKFGSITLDDASGQLRVKVFGEDTKKIEEVSQGDSLMIVGLLRWFNNELYVLPEIIKKVDPKYLLVRKLEIENERKLNKENNSAEKEELKAAKDKILEMIKLAEPEQGIDADKIIMDLSSISTDIINQEVKKLLEDGVIYEPRPGRLRWLG